MTRPRAAFAAFLALAACAVLLLTTGAGAKQKNKKNQQPTTGRIEVSTQPGGYPITIDGQPAGETTDYVRAIELDPGQHTVEIIFPNSMRWAQTFNIIAGRNKCIALNYRPRTIEIPAGGQAVAKAKTSDKVEPVKPGAASSMVGGLPPNIRLGSDAQVVTLCPNAESIANPRVRLKAAVASPEGIPLSYNWKVSGGRIEGEGADVVWDLTGAQPGVYNASVFARYGSATGQLCTAFTSTQVVVHDCPQPSSQPGGKVEPSVDVGDLTGTVCNCGEIPVDPLHVISVDPTEVIPEGDVFTAPVEQPTPKPVPAPKGKKKP